MQVTNAKAIRDFFKSVVVGPSLQNLSDITIFFVIHYPQFWVKQITKTTNITKINVIHCEYGESSP